MTAAAGGVLGETAVKDTQKMERAKVYFSKVIDAEHLNKLYDLIKGEITGKVAIKLHTGERHGPNILPREMVKAFQARIPDSTIVETNTLYHGERHTTEDHRKTLEINGWTFCPVDIMGCRGHGDAAGEGRQALYRSLHGQEHSELRLHGGSNAL